MKLLMQITVREDKFMYEEELCKTIPLDSIIKKVLDNKGVQYDEAGSDSNIIALRRAFYRLLERLGSDKERFKENGKYLFAEQEVPFMIVLLTQLYDNNGIIADFANRTKKIEKFLAREVYEFLDTLKKEIEKAESDEKKYDLRDMLIFFTDLFLWSPLRSLEECHKLIDVLAANLQEIPVDRQSFYLGKIEHILKKEVALRIAESTLEMVELAEKTEISKKERNDDIGSQSYYYESDPEIRFHYIQRDKRVLEAIQEDENLREYIEKKFGQRAEEIFNYAVLDK